MLGASILQSAVISDSLMMVLHYKTRWNIVYIVHHGVIILIGLLMLVSANYLALLETQSG